MNTTHITAQARVDTPLGPVTLAATDNGLAGLWFDAQSHHPETIDAPADPHNRFIVQAGRELAEYFRGEREHFSVPLDARGTAFQQQVWRALSEIPSGETTSYCGIARALGKAAAVRAVGAAVGRNPVSIIVPCHRVLGADGSLTGYAGGLPRKSALLKIEGVERAAEGKHETA